MAMADFGLAAQIGRGNAMPGAQQQQDPQNRMMQMMQLQQLQQNMMLAREQNAREAALAPLREGQLRASTQADEALTPGRQAQSKVYQLALGEKETEQRNYTDFLNVMDRMAKGTFNPADPAAFRDLDPAVRLKVQDQLAKASVTASAAKKAGIELGGVERAVTYDMLSRAGVGITGPREFQSFRDKIVKVTPEADEFLPRYFNPKTAQDLVAFVGSQVANIEKIGDVPYLRIGNSPIVQELMVNRAGAAPPPGSRDTISLPAGVQPPTRAQIGSTALTEPALGANADAETFNAARAAGAVTPPYTPPGAMPSGVPGQRLPVAGGANFQSLAPAGGPVPASQIIAERQAAAAPAAAAAKGQETRAVELAKNQVSSEERRRGAAEVLAALSDPEIETLIMGSTSGYLERGLAGAYGTLSGSATSGMEDIGQLKTIGSQLVTQVLGGKLGGGISNADVDLIKEGVADIGNPLVPANQRLSAFRQLLKNLEMISTGKPLSVASPARARSPAVGPAVGTVEKGYRFKGGDPSKPSSWEKM